ncbi:lycopene cyclase family protein [Salegentibacter sp. F188]|uniref:Lycopene cyclase family protein n=1 Tax=Autumnicola patrickiae TaxID=3075591 RepID=A0ABU3E6D4_9FLAO|nr:lycopene cyclase family protein [Salegentibacter sp. F188]MDT0691549.1 lycopene cyclase family protein [Salegentibacter sp. F188]
MGITYFYVIVGGGLAGLQLAHKLSKEVFFKGKKIAIIDPSEKNENDKTWCFWEKGQGQWDKIVSKTWTSTNFLSAEQDLKLDLSPYKYKRIKSLDFYNFIKKELSTISDIIFIEDEISRIDPVTMQAIGEKDNYSATHFFDSRIPSSYDKDEKYTKIYQQFKGWYIETENCQFDPSSFTMMDYRLRHNNSTSFTYILPETKKKALVEFTFFTPFIAEDHVYDEMLKQYLSEVIEIKDYKIISVESGFIPMTDFPFEEINRKEITKIGTGGGWVKPSTGYSFKSTEKKVDKIVDNIKRGLPPGKDLINKKFRRYDAIFLDVLARHNEKGDSIFSKLYAKNSMENIFKYLDEETSLSEEMKIMFSLFGMEFIASFFRKI